MTDGVLKIESGRFVFVPSIYPSAKIKAYGFKWSSEKRAWIGPLNLGSLQDVCKTFKDVELDKTVVDWERDYNAPLIVPENVQAGHAKDFQKEPIAFLIRRKRAMLALAPGLGKTFCAIDAAESVPELRRILVVSPLSLVRNWRNEIAKWSGKHAAIWHGADIEKASKWVITNYESVVGYRQFYARQKFNLIIVDESVLIKNRDALRSNSIKELCKDTEYVWLLSGSPTTRFYDDLWMQLNVIDGVRFSSYWRFAYRYCIVEKTQWGTKIIDNAENADLKLKAAISDIFYARTQDQVMDLPPWLFDNIEIPMSDSQNKMYEQMEAEFIATLPSGDEVLAPIVLTQMLRLVQIASNPLLIGGLDDSKKWESAAEMLEFEKLPAIIWTSFKSTAKYMTEKLRKKYRVAALTGDTANDERQNIVDKFQSGKLDIIVAHPAVGKFGFTLTAARTAIYLERNYSGDDYYQSLHRIRRIGTTESPHVIHLISCRPGNNKKNTIDYVIDQILKFRKDSSMAITSGEIRGYFGK